MGLADRYEILGSAGLYGHAARDRRDGAEVVIEQAGVWEHARIAPITLQARAASLFEIGDDGLAEIRDIQLGDAGPGASTLYLVREPIDGESLDAVIERVGRAPIAAVLQIVERLARSLAVAHRAGVAHGAIEPASVIIRTSDGRPVLTRLRLAHREGLLGAVGPVDGVAGPDERVADVYDLGAVFRSLRHGTLEPGPWALPVERGGFAKFFQCHPDEERSPGASATALADRFAELLDGETPGRWPPKEVPERTGPAAPPPSRRAEENEDASSAKTVGVVLTVIAIALPTCGMLGRISRMNARMDANDRVVAAEWAHRALEDEIRAEAHARLGDRPTPAGVGPTASERAAASALLGLGGGDGSSILLMNVERNIEQGNHVVASMAIESALEQNPRSALALALRGRLRLAKDETAEALVDLDAALAIEPGLVSALVTRGQVRARRDDAAGALADLEVAVGRRPRDVRARVARGSVRLRVGDVDGALEDCDRALLESPISDALYLRGLVLERRGDADAARRDFRRFVENASPAHPLYEGAYERLGVLGSGAR